MHVNTTSQPPHDRAGPSRPLRLGVVPYLNVEPLIYRLAEALPRADVLRDVPSRLATLLDEGALDVAIVSSIEYFRTPRRRIVGDACIASRGEVASVKIFSRVPPERITRLALDAASRSSVALARIILDGRYAARPALEEVPLESETPALPSGADAMVLIGDRCMRMPVGTFSYELDLGREWADWTGLPFVYAVWTCGDEADLGPLPEALARVRDEGLEHLDDIARAAADRLGFDEALCRRYLCRLMHYRLGPEEQEGLMTFYEHAVRLGLVPEGRSLAFYGD